MSALKFVDN